jgi:hypothetical protein
VKKRETKIAIIKDFAIPSIDHYKLPIHGETQCSPYVEPKSADAREQKGIAQGQDSKMLATPRKDYDRTRQQKKISFTHPQSTALSMRSHPRSIEHSSTSSQNSVSQAPASAAPGCSSSAAARSDWVSSSVGCVGTVLGCSPLLVAVARPCSVSFLRLGVRICRRLASLADFCLVGVRLQALGGPRLNGGDRWGDVSYPFVALHGAGRGR